MAFRISSELKWTAALIKTLLKFDGSCKASFIIIDLYYDMNYCYRVLKVLKFSQRWSESDNSYPWIRASTGKLPLAPVNFLLMICQKFPSKIWLFLRFERRTEGKILLLSFLSLFLKKNNGRMIASNYGLILLLRFIGFEAPKAIKQDTEGWFEMKTVTANSSTPSLTFFRNVVFPSCPGISFPGAHCHCSSALGPRGHLFFICYNTVTENPIGMKE